MAAIKDQKRLELLRQGHPSTPGIYNCAVPGCPHKQNSDGFCPQHNLPLKLLKRKG